MVLLTAAFAARPLIALPVALGLVLGANLGSGILAVLATLRSPPEARRVPLGNLLFKAHRLRARACDSPDRTAVDSITWAATRTQVVLNFHLVFNVAARDAVHLSPAPLAPLAERWLPDEAERGRRRVKPRHLDPVRARHADARDRQRGARRRCASATSSRRC